MVFKITWAAAAVAALVLALLARPTDGPTPCSAPIHIYVTANGDYALPLVGCTNPTMVFDGPTRTP